MILDAWNYWTQEAEAGGLYELHSETPSLKPNKQKELKLLTCTWLFQRVDFYHSVRSEALRLV